MDDTDTDDAPTHDMTNREVPTHDMTTREVPTHDMTTPDAPSHEVRAPDAHPDAPRIVGVPADWPRTEEEARAAQDRLRARVVREEPGPPPGQGLVTGVDVAYDDERDLVAAAAVVLDAGDLTVVAQSTAVARVAFPYVPGLLAFREIPAVRAALDRLPLGPGLVVCDGYGFAHPRRFGLASHLGALTGLPTIGVAKNPFTFTYEEPGPERGATAPLLAGEDGQPGPREVGRAVRTRAGVKPVFVSAGHRTTLDDAVAHALALSPRYRLPETTRRADALCRRALAAAVRAAEQGLPALSRLPGDGRRHLRGRARLRDAPPPPGSRFPPRAAAP